MFNVYVGRQLTQLRSLEEARENVEYLSNLPRITAFTLHSIEVDEPVQQGLLWYYRGIIRYSEKPTESEKRIERDRSVILDRVRRACRHKKWGRSCWHIEGEIPNHVNMISGKNDVEYWTEQESGSVQNPSTGQTKDCDWIPDLPDEDCVRDATERLRMVSDPTRLKTILILAQMERNVTQLCSDLDSQSQPAISHHLALLRHADLVEAKRDGKHNYYELTDTGREVAELAIQLVN